jgi:hypothetical protein
MGVELLVSRSVDLFLWNGEREESLNPKLKRSIERLGSATDCRTLRRRREMSAQRNITIKNNGFDDKRPIQVLGAGKSVKSF